MSTIFYDPGTITHLDCGIWHNGVLQGYSANIGAEISGPLNGAENVVIDFSTAKKEIKAFIDGPNGPDHKLCAPMGSLAYGPGGNGIVGNRPTYQCSVSLPSERVWLYEIGFPNETAIALVSAQLQQDINKHFEQKYPGIKFKLIFDYNISPYAADTYRTACPFSYTHGLSNSTSWGCRNIAHGHRSFVSLDYQDGNFDNLNIYHRKIAEIAAYLDNSYILGQDTLREIDPTFSIKTFRYTDVSNNNYSISFPTNPKYNSKCVTLTQDQPTIENIAEFVADKFLRGDEFKGCVFKISEGLSKGAVINL